MPSLLKPVQAVALAVREMVVVVGCTPSSPGSPGCPAVTFTLVHTATLLPLQRDMTLVYYTAPCLLYGHPLEAMGAMACAGLGSGVLTASTPTDNDTTVFSHLPSTLEQNTDRRLQSFSLPPSACKTPLLLAFT
ncbi:uncharacterized protein B0T23DRAFT_401446 [Neurospora hispaniola]|uniref:Uncharacterized protein n=1 Tax=Neurospora hispaniola TaxID=588809 RepID=A0AAJ0IGP5_9PEZI|nr:hypothetical protein B0T23DRAFT_401446 [Neurospora hispaniola]